MRIDVGISKQLNLCRMSSGIVFEGVATPEKCQMAHESSEFLGDLMWWDVSAGHDDIRDVGVIQA